MRKQILLFLLLSLLCSYAVSQTSPVKPMKRSTTEHHYAYTKDAEEKEIKTLTEYHIVRYDRDGLIESELHYDAADVLMAEVKYEYDDYGNCLSSTASTTNNVNPDNVIREQWKYVWQKGTAADTFFLVEEAQYISNQPIPQMKLTFTYQSDHIIEEGVYFEGSLTKRTVYTNDSMGHHIASNIFTVDEKWEKRSVTTYNETERTSEEIFYDAKDKVVGKTVTKYDQLKNPLEVILSKMKNGKVTEQTTMHTVYDEAGNMMEEEYQISDGSSSVLHKIKQSYSYNQQNDIIEIIYFDSDKKVGSIEYEIEYYR